jgi:phage portal protein BeeE
MNKVKRKEIQQSSKSVNIAQAFNILRGQTSSKNRASMPYRQVDIVFSCVEKLLTSIVSRSVPLILSTVNEEIVESGPVYDRLFKNPKLPFDQFATDWLGNYILFRDVFIYFEDTIASNSPFEVVSGPLMIEDINQGTGEVIRWRWSDNGRQRTATPQQVRQRKNFNPYNRYHGTGPLFACDNAIQYCYSLIMRNASAMRNGAEPGVVLETPAGVNLKPEQVSAILGAFDSRYAGPDKTMSTALITGGMTAKTLALKMVDLQAD